MSTMTTFQRGTPAVSIAPTQNQNTAPVYEFECLFTHDLRKKKKTWHDGALRFHTFNRRIMVYDDSKNFIGDLHYRDADELQEGEELRLDKGVLVDVGRRTGQTDTDLTEVLDRGRHGDEESLARHATPAAAHLSMQRLPSAATLGRPKSLAAVLGASKGPIGRARMAIGSPYEQLHTGQPDSAVEQPPAKRQKIASGKENAPLLSKIARMETQDKSRERPSETPARPDAPLMAKKEINSSKIVIELSSDNESAHSSIFSSAFASSRLRQKGTKAVRNPPVKLDLAPKPPRPRQNLPSKPLTTVELVEVPSTVQLKHRVPAKLVSPVDIVTTSSKVQGKQKASAHPAPALGIPITSTKAQGKRKASTLPEPSARSTHLSSGPFSSLRFAPQKTRPKLMYKDLLPSSSIASRACLSSDAVPASARNERSNEREQGAKLPGSRPQSCPAKEIFQHTSSESVPSPQQRPHTPTRSSVRSAPMLPAHEKTSPLFVSQSPINANTIPDRRRTDSPPVPSPIRTPRKSLEGASVDTNLLQISLASMEEPNHAPQIHLVSKLALMDQSLVMPPSHPEQPPPQVKQSLLQKTDTSPRVAQIQVSVSPQTPSPRPFRGLFSESDSPAQKNTIPVISIPAQTPSAPNRMQQRNLSPAPAPAPAPAPWRPFKSPTKLQRAYSDTSAMLQIEKQRPIGKDLPAILHEEEDADVGPWSKREAFLLFDWWPPGRQKPEYLHAHDEAEQVPERPMMGFMHPRNAESFGQYQGVIRDGIDI